MNSTAYRRMPLAQPSAAASAISCQTSNCSSPLIARHSFALRHPRRRGAARGTPRRLRALPATRGRAAMRSTVSAITAVVDAAARATARISALALRLRRAARRPAARRAASSRRSSMASAGHDVVDEPDAQRLGGGEALGGQEVAPRLPRADRLDHVRADGRRDQPELRLGQRERRLLRGDRDVAAGDEAHAAAVGRAVHARDRRLRHAGRASRASRASAPASARFSAWP